MEGIVLTQKRIGHSTRNLARHVELGGVFEKMLLLGGAGETHRALGAGAESPCEAASADAGGDRLASRYGNVCLHGAEQPHQRDGLLGSWREGFRPAATARGTTLAPRDPFWAALQMAALGAPHSDQEKTGVPQPTLSLVGPGGLAGFTGHCGTRGKASANSVTPPPAPPPPPTLHPARGRPAAAGCRGLELGGGQRLA